jgi:16S rRNA (cytidine1402-2'-O)-methyltransferase
MLDAQLLLGDRPIVVARELTKVHQEFLRGTFATVAKGLSNPKGEITVVVGPVTQPKEASPPVLDADIAHEFWETAKQESLSRGEAVASVARRLGKSKREVYAAIERVKKSVT